MQRAIALILAVFLVLHASISGADTAERRKADALFAALGLPELLDIMRIEGLQHGDAIAAGIFADSGPPGWDTLVSDIYDPDFMTQEVRAAFDEELQGSDLDAMLAFLTVPPGSSIVSLEISARRALLDKAVDATSKTALAQARRDDAPRLRLIGRFIAANNLIDSNVVGALNANYAFYLGLMDGGALPRHMTPDTALQEVWAQEAEIRQSTTDWLEGYLLLAFQPLSDEELMAYLAFSQTEAGQDLTAALTIAFDGLFSDISRSLGLAAARFLISREL